MPAEITLSERHREMLRASCLTDETVAARRLFTMTDSDADREWLARAVNWKAWPKKMGGALVFPMFRPGESEPYAYRPRPDSPIVEKKPNGKKRERKYENPKNGPRCVDFGEPCDVDKYRSESVQRVFWTEGEKKRLYLSQLGYLTVGLTGVTNWNETGTTNLNAAIKQHVRLDCEHTIVFDCPKHGEKRSDEAREMRKLAQALLGTGAPRVRGVFVRDAQAKGVDDYGKKYGDAAVRALIDNAPDVDLGKVDAQVSGWQNELRVNEGDEVLATVDNIECILRNDDRWYGRLVYNERAMRMEVALGSPVQQPGDDGLRALNLDVDAARIASWLGREYELNIDPSSRKLLGAIVTVAHERGYDPFRDWLMSLKWDGVPRLDRWLVDYSEAADTPLHEAFASKFLVSAVARTIEPGTKVDTALILEGPQGAHKSQLLAALVPRSEWFSDDLPADLQNKDAKQHLLGKVLCELSELDALRGSRAETLKAFLARSVDQYRPPYGRSDVHQPRRVVFAGTTNDVEYLQDSTGARRFWPVKVARCNPAGLAAVREQLWAEARVRYERRSVTKETWWFDKDDLLLRRAEDAQLTRSERDPWHDRIETFVCEAVQSPGYLAMDEVLARLGVETRDQNASHSKRVKRLLASLGWTRQRPKIKGVRRWVYRPAGLEQADDNKNDDFVA
jgi:predicted P-loop ATPase